MFGGVFSLVFYAIEFSKKKLWINGMVKDKIGGETRM